MSKDSLQTEFQLKMLNSSVLNSLVLCCSDLLISTEPGSGLMRVW